MTGHIDRTRPIALDELAPAAREEALVHLAQCSRCRAALAGDSPERLFALLAIDRVSPEALDRLSASVATTVAAEGPAVPGRRGFAAASIAASLLLAGLLGTYLFSSRIEPAPGAEALARVEGASAVERDGLSAIGFDVVTPEEAEVVRVQIGDTQVVMVFDEGLNL